jgi:hypothetical protein
MTHVSAVRRILYRLILSAIERNDLDLAWELLRALRRTHGCRHRTAQ